MNKNGLHTMKEFVNMKKQTLVFSILSLLYFVVYTGVSIILGMIVSDIATCIGFWLLNLLSTYVYMRFFFHIAAALRQEETVIYFRDCIPMLVLESILFFFTIAVYYSFVLFVSVYTVIAVIAYLYCFFCVAFQLFCFYQVYRGNRSIPKIVSGALQGMLASWKSILAACGGLAVGYIVLYVCSMGVQLTFSMMLPHVLILNIGVTMNRWMEVITVILTMFMTGVFDMTMWIFLLYQVVAALLFSYFFIHWIGWIVRLCESSWN